MRIKANGDTILTENNLFLLDILGRLRVVPSRRAWVLAVSNTFSWNLLRATRSLPPESITVIKVGSSNQIEIAPLGDAILSLDEPIWVLGRGRFAGFKDE